MSRLDRHIAAVRSKLTLGTFLNALAWATLIFAGVVLLAILVDRLLGYRLPRQDVWFWFGLATAGVAALVYSFWKAPTAHDAAVAIDEKLNLKEKFSTALYVRPSNDPFAMAALRDAEATADNVSLHKQFPVRLPGRPSFGTVAVALLALWAYSMDPVDLFGKEEQRKQLAEEKQRIEQAERVVREALATVESVAKAAPDNEVIKIAKEDLADLLKQPIHDPQKANRTAMKALQDVQEAIKSEVQKNQRYAEAQNDAKMFRSMTPPTDEKGPVADAHRAIAKGDFAKAVQELEKAVENFDKMDQKEKEKAAEQMKQMAQQLQQMANNPQLQQQMQQQLQQMGANQQQAQQMTQLMQQAAQGNQQAQQQLQQMAQQMMQGMNNGQGPNAQQQQQMQQMMQQMQAQANGAATAQQMANAAQQMAQAMQQANQAGGQQAGAQQQMAAGNQAMQQQLQQMDAVQKDAEQVAAAQKQAQQAADAACAACNGGGEGEGQQGQGGKNGQWAAGDPAGKQGAGMGGPGQGDGGVAPKAEAPAGFKQEIAPSPEDEKGRILASTFVKADSIKGDAKIELSKTIEEAQKQATDEIDQERVSHQAQKVVQEYFRSVEKDAQQ